MSAYDDQSQNSTQSTNFILAALMAAMMAGGGLGGLLVAVRSKVKVSARPDTLDPTQNLGGDAPSGGSSAGSFSDGSSSAGGSVAGESLRASASLQGPENVATAELRRTLREGGAQLVERNKQYLGNSNARAMGFGENSQGAGRRPKVPPNTSNADMDRLLDDIKGQTSLVQAENERINRAMAGQAGRGSDARMRRVDHQTLSMPRNGAEMRGSRVPQLSSGHHASAVGGLYRIEELAE